MLASHWAWWLLKLDFALLNGVKQKQKQNCWRKNENPTMFLRLWDVSTAWVVWRMGHLNAICNLDSVQSLGRSSTSTNSVGFWGDRERRLRPQRIEKERCKKKEKSCFGDITFRASFWSTVSSQNRRWNQLKFAPSLLLWASPSVSVVTTFSAGISSTISGSSVTWIISTMSFTAFPRTTKQKVFRKQHF